MKTFITIQIWYGFSKILRTKHIRRLIERVKIKLYRSEIVTKWYENEIMFNKKESFHNENN